MKLKAQGARRGDLAEVREALHATFMPKDWTPGALVPFYLAYDQCDPEFRPQQYRFLRLRGKVVSVLKLFVRTLHHPGGPVPVTVMGGVCTREALRGRGLIKPVIEDSVEYSRRLGASAVLIVTPRPNYYLRHGFLYCRSWTHSAPIPNIALGGARVEPLTMEDAGWMTEMYNASAAAYGPIVRSERYTARWVLHMRLTDPNRSGLKLMVRGTPRAYMIGRVGKKLISVEESVSAPRSVRAQAQLLSTFRVTGRKRFDCPFPAEHPLVRFLADSPTGVRRRPRKQFMYHALRDDFPVPGREFYYSPLDNV